MTQSYESPAKKLARLGTWEAIISSTHLSTAPTVLFLAGPEGGDVSVLRGLGLPFEAMYGVEHNPEHRKQFIKRWPQVRVAADIVDVPLNAFDAVFLDFDGHVMSPNFPRTVRQAFRCLKRKDHRRFAVAVPMGRETWPELVAIKSVIKRAAVLDVREGLKAWDTDPTRDRIEEVLRSHAPDDSWLGIEARRLYIARCLSSVAGERRLLPYLTIGGSLTYRGLNRFRMALVMFGTTAYPRKWSSEKFWRRAQRDIAIRYKSSDLTPDRVTPELWQMRTETDLCKSAWNDLGEPTESELVDLVDDVGMSGRTADLLAMPPGRVAAYRAARTRRAKQVGRGTRRSEQAERIVAAMTEVVMSGSDPNFKVGGDLP